MSKQQTLASAAELFLLAHSSYSPATKRNWSLFLTRTLTSYIASERPVSEITHGDLVRFVAYCEETRGVNRTTLKLYTGFLKRFFEWCYVTGYIDEDPARVLINPRTVKSQEVQGIPPEHLRKILDYAEMKSTRNYAVLLFMAVTGCRVGATSNLLIQNVNVTEGWALAFEKGQRWVTYEFDRLTARALSNWLAERPNCDHDYLWTGLGPDYRPFRHEGIRTMLMVTCKKLKLPHYTPHQIRHSVGEILANNDHSELAVASALNHQNLRSAHIYMPRRMQKTRHLRREIENTLYPDRTDEDEVPKLRILR